MILFIKPNSIPSTIPDVHELARDVLKACLKLVNGNNEKGCLKKMNLTFFSSDKTLRDSCTSLLLHTTCLLFDHIKLQSSRGCFRPLKSQLNRTNNNTTRLQKKLNKNKNLHYIIITSCLLQKIATFHIYLG